MFLGENLDRERKVMRVAEGNWGIGALLDDPTRLSSLQHIAFAHYRTRRQGEEIGALQALLGLRVEYHGMGTGRQFN
jgi:hypothetical protein